MKRLILAFREAALRFSRDGCAFLAQALAFNALFALFPLVVLTLTTVSIVRPNSQQQVLNTINTLAPELHSFIAGNLQSYIYGRGVSSVIALLFIVWSGKNLFLGLAYALDKALGIPKGRPLVHNIAFSLITLPLIGIIMLIAMALPVAISIIFAFSNFPDRQNVAQLGAYFVSLLLVFLVTLMLYTFLPNRRVKWHFAVPGASFAALTWPLVQLAFAQYTIHVNFAKIYGALSAPLVVLLWFYLMGSIFLFGAELSVGWAHLKGSPNVPDLVDVIDAPNLQRSGMIE
ncbi:MAG: YihY/virulence factor BrkB family protein [Candidatus Eremiobacteraeota bacterium]|nr:YihY/virulence factor BrkB family protein [Candidatus Eremiobacteraeota bacterium]